MKKYGKTVYVWVLAFSTKSILKYIEKSNEISVGHFYFLKNYVNNTKKSWQYLSPLEPVEKVFLIKIGNTNLYHSKLDINCFNIFWNFF